MLHNTTDRPSVFVYPGECTDPPEFVIFQGMAIIFAPLLLVPQ